MLNKRLIIILKKYFNNILYIDNEFTDEKIRYVIN